MKNESYTLTIETLDRPLALPAIWTEYRLQSNDNPEAVGVMALKDTMPKDEVTFSIGQLYRQVERMVAATQSAT